MNYKDIIKKLNVKQHGWILKFVDEQTDEICIDVVKQNGLSLQYVEKQTPEICLEAVKQNGLALEFVEKQTPEICLEAVKQNGWALKYVKEQTPEICLAAVKQTGLSIMYVNDQTEELCIEAVGRCAEAYRHINVLKEEKKEMILKDNTIKSHAPVEGFEVGKYYRHKHLLDIRVLCEVETDILGKIFIAEQADGELIPVEKEEWCSENFTEISRVEWLSNFKDYLGDDEFEFEPGKYYGYFGNSDFGGLLKEAVYVHNFKVISKYNGSEILITEDERGAFCDMRELGYENWVEITEKQWNELQERLYK